MRVRDVMTREVRTVQADAPLRECMAVMVQAKVSGLPVLEEDRLVGIITEGDIIRRLRVQVPWVAFFVDGTTVPAPAVGEDEPLRELLHTLRQRPVRELMTPHAVSVSPDDGLPEAARLMVQRNLKRLPVIAERRLVGIISRGDLVRGMLAL